jgi:hypothetical protein
MDQPWTSRRSWTATSVQIHILSMDSNLCPYPWIFYGLSKSCQSIHSTDKSFESVQLELKGRFQPSLEGYQILRLAAPSISTLPSSGCSLCVIYITINENSSSGHLVGKPFLVVGSSSNIERLYLYIRDIERLDNQRRGVKVL